MSFFKNLYNYAKLLIFSESMEYYCIKIAVLLGELGVGCLFYKDSDLFIYYTTLDVSGMNGIGRSVSKVSVVTTDGVEVFRSLDTHTEVFKPGDWITHIQELITSLKNRKPASV